MAGTTPNWKLSPSDFGFLWEECRRCFYLQVKGILPRPKGPFPKIFTAIDRAMRLALDRRPISEIAPGLPAGTLETEERRVKSAPIRIAGHEATLHISGKIDALMRFDRREDGYGVVDFKTSSVRDDHVATYARQLWAYAYAMEHPAPGTVPLMPVTRIGLLIFETVRFERGGMEAGAIHGPLAWKATPPDEAAFLKFLGEVMEVLDRPEPPAAGAGCDWCGYRAASRKSIY